MSPTLVTLPVVEMRTIDPSSRCDTSASPLSRNTMSHGTLRPVAIVEAILGLTLSGV